MGFLKCAIYCIVLGFGSFLAGRLVPDSWVCWQRFPYKPFAWEKNGSFYNRFGIRKWQAKVPDMSKIFPRLIQAKKVTDNFVTELPTMIRETCIAEFIHGLLFILVLPCLWIWPGVGGIAFVVLYDLINLPFIMIQRYNRPRLVRLRKKLDQTRKEENI